MSLSLHVNTNWWNIVVPWWGSMDMPGLHLISPILSKSTLYTTILDRPLFDEQGWRSCIRIIMLSMENRRIANKYASPRTCKKNSPGIVNARNGQIIHFRSKFLYVSRIYWDRLCGKSTTKLSNWNNSVTWSEAGCLWMYMVGHDRQRTYKMWLMRCAFQANRMCVRCAY